MKEKLNNIVKCLTEFKTAEQVYKSKPTANNKATYERCYDLYVAEYKKLFGEDTNIKKIEVDDKGFELE